MRICVDALLLAGLLVLAAVAGGESTVLIWLVGGFIVLSTALSLAWEIRCLVVARRAGDQ